MGPGTATAAAGAAVLLVKLETWPGAAEATGVGDFEEWKLL